MSESPSSARAADSVAGALMPPLSPPDLARTAEALLSEAVEYCRVKIAAPNTERVVALLRAGDPCACGYVHYALARGTAAFLGAREHEARAAFTLLGADGPCEQTGLDAQTTTSPISLILWSHARSATLAQWVEALDAALTRQYARLTAASRLRHLLVVQVVNDEEVDQRIGDGALLSSLHQLPLLVWKR